MSNSQMNTILERWETLAEEDATYNAVRALQYAFEDGTTNSNFYVGLVSTIVWEGASKVTRLKWVQDTSAVATNVLCFFTNSSSSGDKAKKILEYMVDNDKIDGIRGLKLRRLIEKNVSGEEVSNKIIGIYHKCLKEGN